MANAGGTCAARRAGYAAPAIAPIKSDLDRLRVVVINSTFAAGVVVGSIFVWRSSLPGG